MTAFRFVFFDVDSTLVTIEGIDILGAGNPEIARLTELAMNGEVPLDEVYAKRIDAIRPSRAAIEALAQRYLASLVNGAEETVAELQRNGIIVHMVTGGLEQAILPLAAKLNVRANNVHAVRVVFDADGNYADFDRRSPLTRNGGKELVIRDVRARSKGKAMMVGDGVSDLEARAAVDLFIGFGGVHTRGVVKDNAEVFITDLRAVLKYAL